MTFIVKHLYILLLSVVIVAVIAPRSFAISHSSDISEITLEHSGCLGDCPVFAVVIRPDGKATYTGKFHVKRIGIYDGTPNPADVRALVNLIETNDFFGLKPRYDYHVVGSRFYVTDQDMITVRVVQDGKLRSVEDYGSTGPTELRQIQDAIEKLVLQTKWKKR